LTGNARAAGSTPGGGSGSIRGVSDKHAQKSPVPVERDFTAGVAGRRRSFVGSTGDSELDLAIAALAGRTTDDRLRAELAAEMMTTAARIARDGVKTGDFKLMNRALKEMRAAEEVFAPWKDYRKVSIFGSARAPRDQPEYRAAVELAAKLREHGFMTITGAGPGIMAAGNEGAGAADSFGLNISLPFETEPNEFIAGDPKLIDFNYFFTRKLSFVKESDAAVGFPGGFGTMDEVFEAMTLIQTGKAGVYPLVLVDVDGGTYWKFWEQFIVDHLLRNGLISEADLALFRVTGDLDAAVEEIVGFYRVFHSYRYVGDRLVVRLVKRLSEPTVAALESDFADLLESGGITRRGALEAEADEPELSDLPRLVFHHRKGNFGRLREFIDAINRGGVE
jgi:uncharacterized protein (TIGR00730 family)